MDRLKMLISNCKRKCNRASRSPASAVIMPPSIYQDGCRLYIGNLAYEATEQDLSALFAEFDVNAVTIPTNPRTNRPMGYAFVELATPLQAQTAIVSLSGRVVLERMVSVQLAQAPKEVKNTALLEEVQGPSKSIQGHTSDAGSKVIGSPELKFDQASDILWLPSQVSSITSTGHIWEKTVALKFAEAWIRENAGPDSSEEQKIRSFVNLLQELEVPYSKLCSYGSRRVQAILRAQNQVNVPEGSASTKKSLAR